MSIYGKNNNLPENLEFHENKKFILKKQDIKKYLRNLVDKVLNTKSYAKNALSEYNS